MMDMYSKNFRHSTVNYNEELQTQNTVRQIYYVLAEIRSCKYVYNVFSRIPRVTWMNMKIDQFGQIFRS